MICPCNPYLESATPSSPRTFAGATGLNRFSSSILGHTLTKLDFDLLEGVLRRNPVLGGEIDALGTGMNDDKYETYVFTNIDVPVIQKLQGLVRGLHQPLTPIPLPQGPGELYAGSILDGLNPPNDVIVVNLDPDRVFLEETEGVEVHSYVLHDTSNEEERTQTRLQLREAFAFVSRQLKLGKKVLVHCMEGKNRTGVLVSMVLANLSGKSFADAFLEFMDLRGRNLGAAPTQLYIDSAIEILQEELTNQMGKMAMTDAANAMGTMGNAVIADAANATDQEPVYDCSSPRLLYSS
eukprot:jgi/Mesvir1/12867/Mv05893-RA.1